MMRRMIPPPPAAPPKPLRHTILIVDDEPDVVMSVKDLLRLEHRVVGAQSATEGMRILAQEEVHVVMTDQRMPNITGVEFLHTIRGQYPEAIRLLITGYADIRSVIDAINQGHVFRYINKPWDPDELLSITREAVTRYDLILERNRLVEALQRQNAELEASNAQLKHMSALQESFIHVASHELRTPLTLLLGMTSLTLREASTPPLSRWLHYIQSAAERLQRLVEQLTQKLAASQFDVPLQRQPVDLAALLNTAADTVRPFIEQRRQVLVLELAAELGALPLEQDKILDAVDSLLMNAIKFTPDQGRITLAARRTATSVEIRVSDTGVGIPAEHFPLLFRPFYTGLDFQHHSSGHFQFGKRGIGLGLSVARHFVEMHGGTLQVQSEVDRGSTFLITLPTAARPADDPAPAPAPH